LDLSSSNVQVNAVSSPARDKPHPAKKGVRTTLVGVVANVALAAIKGLAGVLGNSYALIADAIESTMDVFHAVVVLSGLTIAAVPPDEKHPYGHGKAEPLAAIVAALGLIAAAIGLAIQCVREIQAPHGAPETYTLFVLVAVIVTKEILYRYVLRTAHEVQSTVVKTDAWHHRSDALTSAAAFIGILVAVVGGPGYESADEWAALIACAIIGYNGVRLLRPALAEVMDTAPPPAVEQTARAAAAGVDRVVAVESCTVRKMGFDYFVDMHVEVDGALTVREGHRVAHAVKDAIRRADARVLDVLIHIEPAP